MIEWSERHGTVYGRLNGVDVIEVIPRRYVTHVGPLQREEWVYDVWVMGRFANTKAPWNVVQAKRIAFDLIQKKCNELLAATAGRDPANEQVVAV